MMTREDKLQLWAWAVVGMLVYASAIVVPAGFPGYATFRAVAR